MEEPIGETRWTRIYQKEDHQYVMHKLMDGSASVTLHDFEDNWDDWPVDDRVDLLQGIGWLQSIELPEILRFVMQRGSHEEWGAIALCMQQHLPREEAYSFILDACRTAKIGSAGNLYQAIAQFGGEEAIAEHRRYLNELMVHPAFDDLAKPDSFNWIATEAVFIACYLFEMGERSEQLNRIASRLRLHSDEHVRRTAEGHLAQFFRDVGEN